jgi:K(+)-stimulated pyrophosphate-energized sodium pump
MFLYLKESVMEKRIWGKTIMAALLSLFVAAPSFANEAALVVPSIKDANVTFYNFLLIGIAVSVVGLIFGFIEFLKVRSIKAHKSMTDVGDTIFETCKTYLLQQGKFLVALEVLIGLCIAFYFGVLQHMGIYEVLTILGMVSHRYSRFLFCSLVWYQDEHTG